MVEDVLNKLRDILVVNLATELKKQDAKFGDDVKLEPVANIVIGEVAYQAAGLPMIRLRAESMENTLYATQKRDSTYRVAIELIVSDTVEESSEKRLWRTIRAIENCFEINAPGAAPIIDYATQNIDFNAPVYTVEGERSTEKGGVISASVSERLDAYNRNQV